MFLSVTVNVARPSQAEGRTLLRNPRFRLAVALGVGAIADLVFSRRPWPRPPSGPMAMRDGGGWPSGVTVSADGRALGPTLCVRAVAPGPHGVPLTWNGSADLTDRRVLAPGTPHQRSAILWTQQPTVEPLGPIRPSAQILDANVLPDGRVIVRLGLASGDARPAWLREWNAVPHRSGPPAARGAIAVTDDGRAVADLSSSDRSSGEFGRLDQVGVTRIWGALGTRIDRLPTAAERLVDPSRAPDGRHLPTTSDRSLPTGGSLTPARRSESARFGDLRTLPRGARSGRDPADPTGPPVAFLARTGDARALGLFETRKGAVPGLADLGPGSTAPISPLDWSSDGRSGLSSVSTPGGVPSGGHPAPLRFVARVPHPRARRLGTVTERAPVWQDDGSLRPLIQPARSGRRPLRQIAPAEQNHDRSALPIRSGAGVGGRWERHPGGALLAIPDPSSCSAGPARSGLLRGGTGADR